MISLRPSDAFYAAQFKAQLEEFARRTYGVAPYDIREDPHVLAFLEHCLFRRREHAANGPTIHGRISRTLPKRVRDLQIYYHLLGLKPFFGLSAISRARELRERFEPNVRRARPLTRDDVIAFLRELEAKTPNNLRLRAVFLTLWETWARPAEILGLRCPDDIECEDETGLTLVIRSSKSGEGTRPEYLRVRHTSELCAACEIADMRRYLGADRVGPLFPGLYSFEPTQKAMSMGSLHRQMKVLEMRIWGGKRHYSPYSFRRGATTAAAAAGMHPDDIQHKLRHENPFQLYTYIDFSALFNAAVSL